MIGIDVLSAGLMAVSTASQGSRIPLQHLQQALACRGPLSFRHWHMGCQTTCRCPRRFCCFQKSYTPLNHAWQVQVTHAWNEHAQAINPRLHDSLPTVWLLLFLSVKICLQQELQLCIRGQSFGERQRCRGNLEGFDFVVEVYCSGGEGACLGQRAWQLKLR